MGSDAIAFVGETPGPHDVYGERAVYPARKTARIGGVEIVTAWQDRDSCARVDGPPQHEVSERPTRVARDDDVRVKNLWVVHGPRDNGDTPGQSRPDSDQSVV